MFPTRAAAIAEHTTHHALLQWHVSAAKPAAPHFVITRRHGRLYQGHFHDLLADVGKEQPIADMIAWVEARVGATAVISP
jgi:hypothetical protein